MDTCIMIHSIKQIKILFQDTTQTLEQQVSQLGTPAIPSGGQRRNCISGEQAQRTRDSQYSRGWEQKSSVGGQDEITTFSQN